MGAEEKHTAESHAARVNAGSADPALPPTEDAATDPVPRDADDAKPQGSSLISLYWDNASHDSERERFGSPPLWSPPQVNRLLRLFLPPADEPTAGKPEVRSQ
jgi:hypothetical protein